MMNELFILGELMEGPQNGYKLCLLMQLSLGKHRKISCGVIYPLFDKLANSELITLTNEQKGRNQNIATITAKGKERFYQLMEQPIPEGAHKEDIYLIKLDAMQHLPLDWQLKLLDEYMDEQKTVIVDAQRHIEKLLNEKCIDHWYAQKKIELRLRQTMVATEWADAFKQELKNQQ
ncbi:MAG: PadR family transcriptional regulator [Spirochaetales bacterium]|jgi:DNA-binding PadR family transcriptional regulator|nr:PadR family transcriptional regulator [Spirochaetales bacterium]